MRQIHTNDIRYYRKPITKPYYVKLIGRNNIVLEIWTFEHIEESVKKYFDTKKYIINYYSWRLECDEKTAEKIGQYDYL